MSPPSSGAGIRERLAAVDLLSGMAPAGLTRLIGILRVRHYDTGHAIVGYLDPTRDVYLILEGTVRVTLFAESGREVSFRDLHAGASFGEISALDGQPRSADVVALTDTVVGSLMQGEFVELLRSDGTVALNTLRKLTGLVRALSRRVYEFSTPVSARICAELLRLGDASVPPLTIVPPPNQSDLASRVSTHREGVSRVLAELQRRGAILKSRRGLVILDRDLLERFAEGVDKLAE